MSTSLKINGYDSETKSLLWEVDRVDWWDTDELLKQFPYEIRDEPSYTDFCITVSKEEALSLHERYRNQAFKWWNDRVQNLDNNLQNCTPDEGRVQLLIYEWESGL